MPTIAVTCSCGKRFAANEKLAGKTVPCPNCQEALSIPATVVPDPLDDPLAFPSTSSGDDPFAGIASPVAHQPPPTMASHNAPQAAVPAKPALVAAQSKKTDKRLIIGLSVGGGILLLVLIVGLFWILNPGSGIGGNGAASVPSNRQGLDIDECMEVAMRFSEAVEAGDAAAARGLIDFDELLRLATHNVDAPKKTRDEFIRAVKSSAGGPGGTFELPIIEAISGGGTYRVVVANQNANETRVWMRMFADDIGLNYHEFAFFRSDDGRPRVADVYLMSTGEFFSQTIRRMYVAAVAADNPTLIQRLTGWESDLAKHLNDFMQLSNNIESRPDLALNAYDRMPSSLQNNKTIMLMRVMAAAASSEKEYTRAFEDFKQTFPNDASIHLMSMDFHVMRGEWDEALAAVDAIDAAVGGDEFLDTVRENIRQQRQAAGGG